MNKLIFVGADPDSKNISHPGGQITASKNIIEIFKEKGFEVDIVDTVQNSFPPPPFNQKIYKGLKRIIKVFKLASSKSYSAAFIFSGSGFSFVERIFLSIICNIFGLKTFLFLRSGHLISLIKKSSFFKIIFKLLINIPDFICVQGLNWKSKLEKLNRSKKILIVRNWINE